MNIFTINEKGLHAPVLKHGPRSLTYMQVCVWVRDICVVKAKYRLIYMRWNNNQMFAPSTDRCFYIVIYMIRFE